MRAPSLLATAAAAALVAATAGSAGAATATSPAVGEATSSVVLASVVAAGTDVAVGTLSLVTSTTGAGPVAEVVVTPLTSAGTTFGSQKVTPASSPMTVAAPDSGLPVGFDAPSFTVTASSPTAGPATSAGSSDLGELGLLGLSVPLAGGLSAGTSVLGTGSRSGKTFEVSDLALPSIADLLGELGLDLELLGELVPGVLAQIVTELGLPIDPALLDGLTDLAELQAQVDDAQAAVDDAQAAVDDASATLVDAQDALAPEELELTELEALEAAAQTAVDDALAAVAAVLGLDCSLPLNLLNPLCVTLADAQDQLADASDAVAAQEAVVAPLQAVVDAAQDAVDTLQTTLDGLLDELADLLTEITTLLESLPGLVLELVGVLTDTPLLSLDAMSVITSAAATSASPGGQTADVVGGEVTGLEVLGTDVLETVLSSSTVAVTDLVGESLLEVQGLIDELTGTLTGLLDGAVPGLVVPAIDVAVLERTTSTSIADGFGVATAALGGLQISIPAITVPDELLPEPPVQLLAADDVGVLALTSEPVTMTVGTLSETVRFRPASTTSTTGGGGGGGTPTTGTSNRPTLPTTGPPALAAAVGLALLGAAAVIRRRTAGDTEQ